MTTTLTHEMIEVVERGFVRGNDGIVHLAAFGYTPNGDPGFMVICNQIIEEPEVVDVDENDEPCFLCLIMLTKLMAGEHTQ